MCGECNLLGLGALSGLAAEDWHKWGWIATSPGLPLCFHSLSLTPQKGARGLRGRRKVTFIEWLLYTRHCGNTLLFVLSKSQTV